jgi:uncharacterized membrane protein YeaQ/YmgE (transglycosylase-associated protein family)
MLLDILFWIALGIAAGSLAKCILPGPDLERSLGHS